METNTFIEQEIKEAPEPVKQTPSKRKKKGNPVIRGVQSVLDGTILTGDKVVRSVPFLFYITFLAILYIANSYYAEKKIIEIEKLKKEIKELRSESISTKSELMFHSRQSQVIQRIGDYGLKESLIPPHKIFAEPDTLKKIVE